MKLIPVLAALCAGAYAQSINIGAPASGTTIATGDVVVQVNRPDSLTGSEEVAIVISIAPCNAYGTCFDPADRLGTTLYKGPYNPQFPPHNTPQDEPQQKFTVSIPDSFAGEKALLSVVHLSLVGAGPVPLFEIVNATVNVVAN
ncbi:unnamed protein product [Peniophora sp. CBMAI 1063]|nr:unnamed protein product [Peniophora sp. CBMAI 1063]